MADNNIIKSIVENELHKTIKSIYKDPEDFNQFFTTDETAEGLPGADSHNTAKKVHIKASKNFIQHIYNISKDNIIKKINDDPEILQKREAVDKVERYFYKTTGQHNVGMTAPLEEAFASNLDNLFIIQSPVDILLTEIQKDKADTITIQDFIKILSETQKDNPSIELKELCTDSLQLINTGKVPVDVSKYRRENLKLFVNTINNENNNYSNIFKPISKNLELEKKSGFKENYGLSSLIRRSPKTADKIVGKLTRGSTTNNFLLNEIATDIGLEKTSGLIGLADKSVEIEDISSSIANLGKRLEKEQNGELQHSPAISHRVKLLSTFFKDKLPKLTDKSFFSLEGKDSIANQLTEFSYAGSVARSIAIQEFDKFVKKEAESSNLMFGSVDGKMSSKDIAETNDLMKATLQYGMSCNVGVNTQKFEADNITGEKEIDWILSAGLYGLGFGIKISADLVKRLFTSYDSPNHSSDIDIKQNDLSPINNLIDEPIKKVLENKVDNIIELPFKNKRQLEKTEEQVIEVDAKVEKNDAKTAVRHLMIEMKKKRKKLSMSPKNNQKDTENER
ncbi:MAG: hypothetical protein JJV93_02225 [Alphaproteobacteria bacterium]|nr:hypothetical protein [Alphaproteobacteria bacterium]